MKSASPSHRAVLPALFDAAQGWPFSLEEVPLKQGESSDGTAVVLVDVDGREIVVVEETPWDSEGDEAAGPHRIVAFVAFSGVAVSNAQAVLLENFGTRGLPAWGVDEDGDLTLSASLPVSSAIPLDIVRRQLLVSLGLIAETVDKLVEAVAADAAAKATNGDGKPHPAPPPRAHPTTRKFLAAL